MRRRTSLDITADMVANVIDVGVRPGDTVAAGDTAIVLESMKMEIPVLVESAGTVTAVNVRAGDVIQEGDVLLTIAL